MNEWTAEECEELLGTVAKSVQAAWALGAEVIACVYRNGFWEADGSLAAYAKRTMGELPRTLKDFFVASLVEDYGVPIRAAAEASGMSKSAAGRAAAFFKREEGGSEARPEPELSEEQMDWQRLTETIRATLQANQKLLTYSPTTKGTARQLRTELTQAITFLQSKIAWLDEKEESLKEDSDEIAPRRGTMFSYGADGKFYQR